MRKLGKKQLDLLTYVAMAGSEDVRSMMKLGFRRRTLMSLHRRGLVERTRRGSFWRLTERTDWNEIMV